METLLQTDTNYVWTFVRIIAGIIIFPYGMQKLFGWFDGVGIKGTVDQMAARRVPQFIAWMIIIGQSFGSMALILGFLGRIAAGGLFIIFAGALIVHLPDGWSMNWFGKKSGEGIEYHIMLLALLLIVIVKGSGAMSIDLWLIHAIGNGRRSSFVAGLWQSFGLIASTAAPFRSIRRVSVATRSLRIRMSHQIGNRRFTATRFRKSGPERVTQVVPMEIPNSG
ncbi:MAG TPA: DoxX family protein [Pyrinomonadaceae bacterium]|nr:DoxX family protein [Pyrinomonadaceae bacterium]